MSELPTLADIRRAARTIEGKARRTPLLESALLNERLGCRLLVKPEMLQVTGSFKFRGAYNRISQIAETDRRKGVVAFSSGNHAQGVAAAARLLAIPATIVMPGDAPAIKINNTRAYGARVVFYDRNNEDRDAITEKLTAESGATMIRPYDDTAIIAGQGTVGLEIATEMRRMGITADLVLAPCGGGGLVAGTALAMASSDNAGARVFSVEPEGFDDTARSLAAGKRVGNVPGGHSICDALMIREPGRLTFEVNKQRLAGGLAVSDQAVGRAMAIAFHELKLVSEPAGAVALAAALGGASVTPVGALDMPSGALDIRAKTVVVIMSGGNVDGKNFQEILSRYTPANDLP